MIFENEAQFEEALIANLKNNGWDDKDGVLWNPTEKQLVDNWASIIFENNNNIDRLNGCPLTDSEMAQILEQVTSLRTPLKLNAFINGKTVAITRDNADDKLHCGKEVSLKIFHAQEIATGQTRYQIAQQPQFTTSSKLTGVRRGDVMLLINGMPVIHIELKRTGVPASQAVNQIGKYLHEGVFTGIFSLVQVFVAMNPEEMLYFASPGTGGKVNERFCFHWADFNNEPVNDWKTIASKFLSIPEAHQLIGFYTVADKSDGALKVMRSYQLYAARAISDRVAKVNARKQWGMPGIRGGYIWHTTGSGKTMTSFKSAQLIANSRKADKVVFLMDRIELGTQSLAEYRAQAADDDAVQGTQNTAELRSRLKSSSVNDMLIVTSIQKMSLIRSEEGGITDSDLEQMRGKRIVFIIDECHRSTFGDMLRTIKDTFPDALFFGFTGTPIHEENAKKMSTTTDVFGDELHRYSIADGIRDGNVLGFDPYMICTFKDASVREAVALNKAKADSVGGALSDDRKSKVYYYWMDTSKVGMGDVNDKPGSEKHGIEHFVPSVQYQDDEHRRKVVEDILSGWERISHGGKFHGLLATSSIPEAIEYFRMFRDEAPQLKVTALFDPNIDNSGDKAINKEEGLKEIIEHYNATYGTKYTIPTHAAMKKDMAARLAHKRPHLNVENHPEERIDVLIVVDQMLTGFDSKWINILYLDKVIDYALLIQAFSRTNRLFAGDEKPFGIIRYYRKPHTMRRNIEEAVKLYSGDKPFGLFASKLPENMAKCNELFAQMEAVFKESGSEDFSKLPESDAAKAKFAELFNEFHEHLEATKVQGFSWGDAEVFGDQDPDTGTTQMVEVTFDESRFNALVQRYKELSTRIDPSEDGTAPVAPFDIKGYLTEIDTGHIDTQYMNENFTKWFKALDQGDVSPEELDALYANLHRTFATLSQEDQSFAELFIHDIQSGEVSVESGMTLRDYITRYAQRARSKQVAKLVDVIGVDEEKLETMMRLNINEANINDFGRFDALVGTVDKAKARAYFERVEGTRIPPFKVNARVDKLLRRFLESGGFDIE